MPRRQREEDEGDSQQSEVDSDELAVERGGGVINDRRY